VPLGTALFALAVADVGVMHFGTRWADRRGRRVPLALALAWGALVTAGLAAVGDPVLFTLGALAAGVTVGATWVLPVAMTVDLAAVREPALAAYRIASDVGMLAGGLLAGVGIAAAGLDGALLGMAGLLLAGLVLTLAVGETAPRSDSTLEEPVPLPPIEQFAVLADNQDISLTPERLAQAHAAHTRYRADLERLRALPLPFTEPVTEPSTALAWLQQGARP
jgi:MFS family permease